MGFSREKLQKRLSLLNVENVLKITKFPNGYQVASLNMLDKLDNAYLGQLVERIHKSRITGVYLFSELVEAFDLSSNTLNESIYVILNNRYQNFLLYKFYLNRRLNHTLKLYYHFSQLADLCYKEANSFYQMRMTLTANPLESAVVELQDQYTNEALTHNVAGFLYQNALTNMHLMNLPKHYHQCLYLLSQYKSVESIALEMDVNKRKVYYWVSYLKRKFNCFHLQELVDFAHTIYPVLFKLCRENQYML
ncbi:hypothetical protein [Fangia hongkongensis]|uniref:hypothetical protein n=1 Tax=Fangia hongkongensis TaxID=270495 RepID=UPI00037678DC|nr:hypothetical protein [Fangia hongkongensis]MBK2124784.1 hypothetical protein [Fangia hongkongensis]